MLIDAMMGCEFWAEAIITAVRASAEQCYESVLSKRDADNESDDENARV